MRASINILHDYCTMCKCHIVGHIYIMTSQLAPMVDTICGSPFNYPKQTSRITIACMEKLFTKFEICTTFRSSFTSPDDMQVQTDSDTL